MITHPEDYDCIPDKYEALLNGKIYNQEDKTRFYHETMASIEKAKC
jgi:hypothetical protein